MPITNDDNIINTNSGEVIIIAKPDQGTLRIGEVTTVSSDEDASASIDGLPEDPVLNLAIPRGVTGNESILDSAGRERTDVVWSADKILGEIISPCSDIEVEQGVINYGGVEADSANYIRTVTYSKFSADAFPFTVAAASGYKVGVQVYYDSLKWKTRFTAAASIQLTANNSGPNCWIRFIVAKDPADKIYPPEFSVAVSGIPSAENVIKVNKVYDLLNKNISSVKNIIFSKDLFVEQGSIKSSKPYTEQDDQRYLRTGYLKFGSYPFTVTPEEGYLIGYRTYNEDFSDSSAKNVSAEPFTIRKNDGYVRILIARSDLGKISLSEFSDSISDISDAVCALRTDQVYDRFLTQKASVETRLDSLELDTSQFNLNMNMTGNSNMCFEYHNWVYPQTVYFHGIYDRLYFTFTNDSGYSGIAQYDFDTKAVTKTILKRNVNGVKDDHDVISVLMRSYNDEHRLLCAYSGGHGTDTNMYIRYASARESIENFEQVVVLPCAGNTTYAQLFEYNDTVYLFYRCVASKWAYRTMTWDGKAMGTWSDETILIQSGDSAQMYCQFGEALENGAFTGVLRVLAYTNPDASDTAIRMGFLHLDTMTLYDVDNETELGTSEVQRENITAIIPTPTGKVNRLFHAAKTEIDDVKILYCTFTNANNVADGTYYIYDNGTVVNAGSAGYPLWDPKYQLGIHWIGTDKLVKAYADNGTDYLSLCSYASNTHTLTEDSVIDSHSNTGDYRTARPMVDSNNRVVLYNQGYYGSYFNFIMDSHAYDLENELKLF